VLYAFLIFCGLLIIVPLLGALAVFAAPSLPVLAAVAIILLGAVLLAASALVRWFMRLSRLPVQGALPTRKIQRALGGNTGGRASISDSDLPSTLTPTLATPGDAPSLWSLLWRTVYFWPAMAPFLFGLVFVVAATSEAMTVPRQSVASWLLAASFGIPGGYWAQRMWRRAWRWRWLWRHGVVVDAGVDAVEFDTFERAGGTDHFIRYWYLGPDGKRHTGESHGLAAEFAIGWRRGDVGDARYDPRHPASSVWIGSRRTPARQRPSTLAEPPTRPAPPPLPPDAPIEEPAQPAPPADVVGPALVGTDGTVWPLTKRRLSVGRSLVCEVRIEDPSLAYQHANLFERDGAWHIEPAIGGGTIQLNGEPIAGQWLLTDSDHLRLGSVELRFVA
jgi:hypothetical protein